MAVTDEPVLITYNTNGVSTDFAFPAYFAAAADLQVVFTLAGVQTLKVLGTDYSVVGTLDPKLNTYSGGGTVHFTVPPVTGGTIEISRHTPLTQPAVYAPNDPFPAGTHEAAMDRLTLILQEIASGFTV